MLTIKYSTRFLKDAKRLKEKKNFRKIADDINGIEESLKTGKDQGSLIPGLSGLQIFKIRQRNSSTNTGKSGGFRIIYYQMPENNIELIASFPKHFHQKSYPTIQNPQNLEFHEEFYQI